MTPSGLLYLCSSEQSIEGLSQHLLDTSQEVVLLHLLLTLAKDQVLTIELGVLTDSAQSVRWC